MATDDLAEALRSAEARIGHLCTPTACHVPQARQLLAAGCHVIVEKPMAATGRSTEELLAAAASRSLMICPVHQLLFQRGVARAEALRQDVGPWRHIDAVACSAGGVAAPAAAQDDIVEELLPHPLSLFARLAGPSVAAANWSVLRPHPGELRAWGSCDGVSYAMTVSLAGRPTRNSLRLIGEQGTVHVDLFHGFAVREGSAVSRARKLMRPFVLSASTLASAAVNLALRTARWEPAYPGLRELVGGFYEAVARGGPPPISAGETLDVARARDQILQRVRRSDAKSIPA
jgi:predicted dehydrogenase